MLRLNKREWLDREDERELDLGGYASTLVVKPFGARLEGPIA